jgi:hypothetical protein
MRAFELGDVIAERVLTFESATGASTEVVVRLGRPVRDGSEPAWLCPYQVSGLGRDRVMAIFGVDSAQALLLALHTIPAELIALERIWVGRFLHNGHVEDGFTNACRFVVELATEVRARDSSASTSVTHFKALSGLVESLSRVDAELVEHHYHDNSFGSWWVIVRRHRVDFRIVFDGKDSAYQLDRALPGNPPKFETIWQADGSRENVPHELVDALRHAG